MAIPLKNRRVKKTASNQRERGGGELTDLAKYDKVLLSDNRVTIMIL